MVAQPARQAGGHQEKPATDHSADEPLTYEQAEAVLQGLAFTSLHTHPGLSGPPFVPEKPIPLEHVPEVFPGTIERPSFPAPHWTEKSFWSLFEAAPDGIVVIDPGGTIVLVNSQVEKMFGYRREELQGQAIEVLVPERFRSRHVQHRTRFFANLHSRPMGIGLDLFGRHKNGQEFFVEISLSVLEAEQGTLVTSTIRDVTDRREREAFLRKAEARYRTLVEEIPAVTFMAALDEGINELYVSPQIEELLGFSQKEWLEDPVLWFKQLHPDDRDRWHIEFAHTCATARPFRSIYRFLARDGHVVWVHGEAKVFRDDDGWPLFLQGVAFDISGIKRAEEELLALNQTLEHRVAERTIESEKRAQELARSNDALEDFAGVTAHELKEPLRAMKSFAQLLARRYKGELDAQADEFIGRIVNAGNRMEGLISALLDYARVGRQGTIAPVHCGEVFSAVCLLLEKALEETGAQVTTKGLDSLEVIAVETELVLLFKNLVGNALKFRGDRLVQIHVEVRQQEATWLFSVRDNGIGIAPEYLNRLFRMGERLHSRTKFPGHGIGLATCKKIVERHGGQIWIESESDKGSTFYFTLPTLPR
jgi:PAS domain S-box-containing protein